MDVFVVVPSYRCTRETSAQLSDPLTHDRNSKSHDNNEQEAK